MTVPGQQPIRILHVDDDADFADLVATILQRKNDRFDIETANDASAGLAAIADFEPDCVVSDYDMPGDDGITFLKQVREGHPSLPFILYTGKGSEEVASRAISAGVTDYIQKAAGQQEYELLANRIENAVAQSRAEDALELSEARLRTVIDSIPHAVFVVNEALEYVISNPEHAASHGMTVDDVQGTPANEVLPPPVYEQFEAEAQLAMETGETRFEPRVEMPGPSGEPRVYESRLVPIETIGSEGAVLGIAIDITDRETG